VSLPVKLSFFFLEVCCDHFLGLPSDVHERDGHFAALNKVQATDLTFACLSCSGRCATVEESVPKRRDLGWCFLRIYPIRVVWLHSPVPDRECVPHPRLRTLHMVIRSFAPEQVSLTPCACKHAANDLTSGPCRKIAFLQQLQAKICLCCRLRGCCLRGMLIVTVF
jgi:hypothetical protein